MTKLRMQAMALDIPDFPDHPNRVPFSGVLTELDVPSDEPPKGAMGHRVILPAAVAQRALGSLLGMAVNYTPGLGGHDVRRKIGVITRADIRDGALEVAGYLFGKDFPDVVKQIRARRDEMGMSYEITEVALEDDEADVWVLSNVVFTGAAILEKEAAAFKRTSLAATRSASSGQAAGAEENQGGEMDEKELKKSVFASIEEWFRQKFGGTAAAAEGLTEQDAKRIAAEAATAVKTELGAQITALTEENKQLKAGQSTATVQARCERWNAAVRAAQQAGKLTPALLKNLAVQAELAITATAKVKVPEIQADKSTKEVEVDPLDALIKHVEAMPQSVPLGELAAGAGRGSVIEFTPSRGIELDAESVTRNARAEQIAAELRKQDPKMTELAAFKEGLSQARRELASPAKAGGIAAGAV